MSEMIERVAMVIKGELGKALNATPLPGDPHDHNDWSATGGSVNLEDIARAAISAMREPTEAMVGQWPYDRGNRMTWRAMIDEALKEG